MELETIKSRVETAVPGACVHLLHNDSPSGQHSLLVDASHVSEVAVWLRDDPELRLDF
jgi:NADH-quinone oxidoreductase subunit C